MGKCNCCRGYDDYTHADTVDLLMAISRVSKRLARNIVLLRLQEEQEGRDAPKVSLKVYPQDEPF